MDAMTRVEQTLKAAVARGEAASCPPRLARAVRYAVFPGGARIRPRLALAVAHACGDDAPRLAEAGAAAVELMHCASLVHDDLPCFDDAETRRGKPSVHKAFDERLAVLTGDALIVLAFQVLAQAAPAAPDRLPALVAIVGASAGLPSGISAGQAWECEPAVSLSDYHREKTGALFAAATMAGAAAAGFAAPAWRELGETLGEAYQVADDLRDVAGKAEDLGKPVGRDAALGRPSAAAELGVAGAMARLDQLVRQAIGSIPDCPGRDDLRDLILLETKKFLPKGLAQSAA